MKSDKIHKSYKYRLYPNLEQQALLRQFFGAKRFIWNRYLAENIRRYEKNEKRPTFFNMTKDIPQLKKCEDTAWLKDMDSKALEYAAKHLNDAYSRFFKGQQNKGPKVGFPKFKSRFSRQSYTTGNSAQVDWQAKRAQIPKIGKVRVKLHKEFSGRIVSANISKETDGTYWISYCVECNPPSLLPKTGREVGVDLGIKNFVTLSSGITVGGFRLYNQNTSKQSRSRMSRQADSGGIHTHDLRSLEEKLRRAQRKLANKREVAKKRGYKFTESKSYHDQKRKVARLYARISRKRQDFHHKLSHHLMDYYDGIYVEDLNVQGLSKNRKLSSSIQQQGWSQFIGFLEYKAEWTGRSFKKIARTFPSTKQCHKCKHKKEALPLNIRKWTCPECGTEHDRDLNAAMNIQNEGSAMVSEQGQQIPVPKALEKHYDKTERSSHCHDDDVIMGTELIALQNQGLEAKQVEVS